MSELPTWAVRAVGAALIATFFETALAGAIFPVAVTGHGVAAWIHVVVAVHLAVALVLAVLLTLFERGARRVHTEEPGEAGTWLATALLGFALVQVVSRFRAPALTEFPERVALVHAALRLAALLVAVVTARLVLRPLFRSLSASISITLRTRLLPAIVFGAFGVAALLFAHAVLTPIHLYGEAAAAGCVALAFLAFAVERAIPQVSRDTARVVLSGALLVVVSAPLSLRNAHARFVLFNHTPVAGRVALVVQNVLDLDHDGAGPAWLGGADCAELDAGRGPAVREIAANGIDDDCRGGDAPKRAVGPQSAVAPWEACSPPDGPRSVILVTIDALRADGLDAAIMPALVHRADSAIRFDRAYAPATSTQLSLPAIFAGRSPTELVERNLFAAPRLVVDHTLPMRFRDAGYRTVGFDYFLTDERTRVGFTQWNAYPDNPHPHTIKHAFAAASLVNGSLDALARTADKPVFLWMHVPDAHAPYLVPDDLPAARDLARTLGPYGFELAFVDHELGRFFERLERSGVLERTVVAVTADHGEALGERGREGHGVDVFENVAHVPLLLWAPGCTPRRIADPVSLVDLAPTLAALAGQPASGRTLFPANRTPPPPVVVESALGPGMGMQRAVIAGATKLVHDVRGGGYLLFDLASDPMETKDLYGDDPTRDGTMQQTYQRWLDRTARQM